ncbi:site-2 protease family protein [Anatilimnocola aggregata]|nr:site-2 protease family protein [Anatilimnocola aggregata]
MMDPVKPTDSPAPASTPLLASTTDVHDAAQPQVSDDGTVRYEPSAVTDITGDDRAAAGPRTIYYAVRLPLILFLLSCVSIFIAGCSHWWPQDVLTACLNQLNLTPLRRSILAEWPTGLAFMCSLLGILLAHEMGHFVMTMIYRVRATLPLVIPFPLSPIGTMGAVIVMEGGKANRREIFDIGIAGPLAGLIVAIPVLWLGITQLDLQEAAYGIVSVKPPLLMDWWLQAAHPGSWKSGAWLGQLNPYLMAGWTGLFFTGLNMFPVGQLDGGHITYCLLGRRAHWLARGLMVLTFAYFAYTGNTMLILMALLVMLMGTDHPPTSDDTVPLGWPRIILGWASLIIPIVCLTPEVMAIR